jgi:hypothetical protein
MFGLKMKESLMVFVRVVRLAAVSASLAAALCACQGDDNSLPLPADASTDVKTDAAKDGASDAPSDAATDAPSDGHTDASDGGDAGTSDAPADAPGDVGLPNASADTGAD